MIILTNQVIIITSILFQGICNHQKVAHFTVSSLMALTIQKEMASLNMAYQHYYVVN